MQAIPTGPSTSALPGQPAQPNVVQLGAIRAAPLHVVMAEERAEAQEVRNEPIISGLVQYLQSCWQQAWMAKLMKVDERLLRNLRARRGVYDPEKLSQVQAQGGSDVYAGLTAVKCRAAASWVRDIIMGTGTDRPWTIRPTSSPDISPEMVENIVQTVSDQIKQSALSGQPMNGQQVHGVMAQFRDQMRQQIMDMARHAAERMAEKMEAQLIEGGFMQALDEFIEDMMVFPAAVIKGPIVRKKSTLQWARMGTQYQPVVQDKLVLEWERVDPFNIFPSPAATGIDDGYLFERHHLSREDLNQMIGVDGYNDASIRAVLDEYGRGGLRQWLINDMAQAEAEGKSTTAVTTNSEGHIDALQFWGSVQGKWLIEWGMSEKDIPDPTVEYHVEIWRIGDYVIKAALNYDPLHRKPYYKASYEHIPGAWWGNSVADIVRDIQVVVNAATRALVNNMSMASGPQVGVNVSRMPQGEEISTLSPWKIWQFTDDPIGGGGGAPVTFFQPESFVNDLAGIIDKFSDMADNYSGIPKYMAGETPGTVGRTASGMSMLMNNAGKAIKQVISNIDMHMWTPMLTRLYDHNMRYSDDSELKGDVQISARGSSGLVAKDATQLRRNEFLQATANPIDMQIVGVQGRAAILREVAKGLDMDTDKIVPTGQQLAQKLEIEQQMQQSQQGGPQGGPQGAPPGAQPPAPATPPTLADGHPVTNNFPPAEKLPARAA